MIIRFRNYEVHTSNTKLNSLQSGVKENGGLKTNWRLEAGRHDLAILKAIKQSGELEGRIRTLVGEKEVLLESVIVEREREQTEAKNQIRDLQGENQKLENEIKLLEERIAGFKGDQTFFDRYAGAEIMNMVEDLNDEIFQKAGLVSELLGDENAFELDKPEMNAQLTRGDKDNLTKFIGSQLLEYLSNNSEQLQVDPFPLQLAVQAMLTRWCVFMVDSFYPGPASNDLKKIYRRIWESGRHKSAYTMYMIINIIIF